LLDVSCMQRIKQAWVVWYFFKKKISITHGGPFYQYDYITQVI
jgi:hypothetical protein